MLLELNEVLDKLHYFLLRSIEFPEMLRITSGFFLGGSSNVVDRTHTGIKWGSS